jgi:hypothetical protein
MEFEIYVLCLSNMDRIQILILSDRTEATEYRDGSHTTSPRFDKASMKVPLLLLVSYMAGVVIGGRPLVFDLFVDG